MAEALGVVRVGNSEWLFTKWTPRSRSAASVGASTGFTEPWRKPSAMKMMILRGEVAFAAAGTGGWALDWVGAGVFGAAVSASAGAVEAGAPIETPVSTTVITAIAVCATARTLGHILGSRGACAPLTRRREGALV